ncbi:replication initiation protein RepC [Rhizobium sp. PP-F2F-G38]|nr:replication initiation protein RepC [Rhizobium sp. PP-WC-1G-195]PYE91724.1 replication initiation protein RepC [Rhizobium sp. PP-F2F-G38]TCP74454.1 replication initiation protein RepC [Rhizobium sp. PP-CC-2G-626]
MESRHVTTPFGRRSMTLAMLAGQAVARNIEPGKAVDKWKLYRALCEARPLLGVSDRALAVVNALLSFYPKGDLAEKHGLVVFPSNMQLSLRAHGMAEQTIRRHLAALIDAGLLVRKDSPNGKRYAHKGRTGNIDEAFGFSLAPLLARVEEIEGLAAQVIAERLALQRLRERLTLCRRDVSKLVETALEEGAPGDWAAVILHQRSLITGLSRNPTPSQIEAAIEKMEMLRDEVVNRLELLEESKKMCGNPIQSERHIQSSNTESLLESEPLLERELGAKLVTANSRDPEPTQRDSSRDAGRRASGDPAGLKTFPLGLVLRACPQIEDYGPGGAVANWRDLMAAAVVIRSMLGISPSAYEEACAVMGPENAATVVACILERAGHITSAGGYLRDLTRRAERGEFGLGPLLMALLRGKGMPVSMSRSAG